MDKKSIKNLIISILSTIAYVVVVFFTYKIYTKPIQITLFALVPIILGMFLLGVFLKKQQLFKFTILIVYFGSIVLLAASLVIKAGILEKIDSAAELVTIVNNYGVAGKLIFVLIQFLQVTFIPIPSTVVTAAGAALYSTWESLLLSCCGLWLGSLVAFFLGRTFGVKLVKWVIGEDMLLKYTDLVKGKDKAMLVYMFIFPVFPDDMLCMIAGLTTMSYPAFIAIQLIARPLNVACTVFLVDYITAIPFSGWGIAIWISIAVFFITVFILMWKYAQKLEDGMLKFISKIRGKPIIRDVNAIYRIKVPQKHQDNFNENQKKEKSSEELFNEYNQKLLSLAVSRETELLNAKNSAEKIITKTDKELNF